MYRPPSHRKTKKEDNNKINLVPILDAVFILIFFLLLSSQFLSIFEINSDVPLVSANDPPPKKKPLALTVEIRENALWVFTGVPSRLETQIPKDEEGEYDFVALHNYMVEKKRKHVEERTIIIEPVIDVEYEKIVQIMDAVRMLLPTDETFFMKNKEGIEEEVQVLFDKIMFGNIFS